MVGIKDWRLETCIDVCLPKIMGLCKGIVFGTVPTSGFREMRGSIFLFCGTIVMRVGGVKVSVIGVVESICSILGFSVISGSKIRLEEESLPMIEGTEGLISTLGFVIDDTETVKPVVSHCLRLKPALGTTADKPKLETKPEGKLNDSRTIAVGTCKRVCFKRLLRPASPAPPILTPLMKSSIASEESLVVTPLTEISVTLALKGAVCLSRIEAQG
ncbi:hypothetical protein MUP77_03090, partial [Candidatus Bathyarchaeota archaeon]|nr:hypothetical protein [Candidatus Bathyarchaeota archaeon]